MALFKPEFGLIFWMLVVFLIILGILAKYAWPVIIRSIEQRAELIDNGVKYAEATRQELKEVKVKVGEMVAEAHRQQLESLQETERMKQGMIEEARKMAFVEAEKIKEDARLSIEQARKEAELQVRKQVGRLSLEIAEKVLRKDLAGDTAQVELIDQLLNQMK
ncbi:MAG: F0F1 ATP synthase subunit B [Odoribacter sp.]